MANFASGAVQTSTTYLDFESRDHLTQYVEDFISHAIGKFVQRRDTRVEVTLGGDRNKRYEVGVTLRMAKQAPIHVMRAAGDVHQAIRDAVHTVEKILRRSHSKRIRRHRAGRRQSSRNGFIGGGTLEPTGS